MRDRDVRLGAIALAGVVWLSSGTARAGELEDYQAAQAAYDVHDFPLAISRFEALVGGATPSLTNDALILESRKYLGAAYLIVGRREAAEAQFELLLAVEPTYELEAAAFPVEVIELFAAVRQRLAEEARVRTELETAADLHRHDLSVIASLVEFAQEESAIEISNSRWVAALPLGVGQFVNGDDGLGAFFLVAEGLCVLTAIGTLIGWQWTVDQWRASPRSEWVRRGEAARLADALEISNWASLAALGAFAFAGILEAELNFRPTHSVGHRRVVPPEYLEGVEGLDLSLSIGPTGASLSISF